MVKWNKRYGYEFILFHMYVKISAEVCGTWLCAHKSRHVCRYMSTLHLCPHKPWEQAPGSTNAHTPSPDRSFQMPFFARKNQGFVEKRAMPGLIRELQAQLEPGISYSTKKGRKYIKNWGDLTKQKPA